MIITADELPRVIACEGSLAMGKPEGSPVANQSPQAIEGTACHYISALTLTGKIENAYAYVGKQTPNGIFITSELAEYAQRYVDAVTARAHDFGATMYVETQTDFTPFFGYDIHGRADLIVWNSLTETFYVDDAKFGYRFVEPEENWTLIAHAIGFCRWNNIRPKNIVFTIHQPRPFHPLGMSRSWTIHVDELDAYSNFLTVFFKELGTSLNTGPQCRNCAARPTCPAAIQAAMNAIDVIHDIANVENIPNASLGDLLDQIDRANDHLKTMHDALTQLARHRIENDKAIIPGYGLDIGYGHRKFNPGVTPASVAMLALSLGVNVSVDKLTEPAKIISPAQAKKNGVPETLINALSTRPTLGVRLVKQDIQKLAAKAFQ